MVVDGQECAGKSLYNELIEGGVNGDGYNHVLDKYYRECELMSRLEHPNVTKFLGVCAMPDYQHPVLVMRKLDGNLSDLLKGYTDPALPFSLKLSVVSGVAKGLHYLHNFNAGESIIHRDLTTRNVLLTSRMVAQITDFGVSKIVGKRPVLTLSPVPGCIEYMPPEALETDSAHYGPSLDIFSLGHLILVAMTQVI